MRKSSNFISRREFLEETAGLAALGAFGSMLPMGASLLLAADLPKPGEADWPRFGHDIHNTRFNDKEKTIGPETVAKLKVKWQFDTVDNWPPVTTPAVIGDRVFIGAGAYQYALDSATGELKWKTETGTIGPYSGLGKNQGIRSSSNYYNGKVYYGTPQCDAVAVDAATGKILWKTNLEKDTKLKSSIFYAPVVYKDRVIMGYTSEMAQIVCLDADTGAIRWRYRVVPDVPEEIRAGGGSLWTSGAIDEQMNATFNVTGDSKSFMPAGPVLWAESVLAHDLDTGELLWGYQAHPNDAFDIEYCAHPMIFDAVSPERLRNDVRQCVGAGNKAGFTCLNRHSGELYWRVMLGQACASCGPLINSTAVAYNKVYIQNASPASSPPLAVTAALNAYNGEIEWIVPNPQMSSAPIAIANGVLYQGLATVHKLEALNARNGRRLWEYTLPSEFRGGVAIANGALYTSNGEPQAWKGDQKPYKHSIFCFTIDGK